MHLNLLTQSRIPLVGLFVVLFTSPALSQDIPRRGPVSFATYDQNGDASISETEFNATREKMKAAGRPLRNARSFAQIDSNSDGKISQEEFANYGNRPGVRSCGTGCAGAGHGAMPTFDEFDLNKDGKITEEEFVEARTARITQRAKAGYPMQGLANAASFADIDTDHDGAVSPEEFSAHQVSHRQRMGR